MPGRKTMSGRPSQRGTLLVKMRSKLPQRPTHVSNSNPETWWHLLTVIGGIAVPPLIAATIILHPRLVCRPKPCNASVEIVAKQALSAHSSKVNIAILALPLKSVAAKAKTKQRMKEIDRHDIAPLYLSECQTTTSQETIEGVQCLAG